MITIVDYGMGNLRSVEKALERVGARVRVSRDPKEIEPSEGLVLPGVGAFEDCMANLRRYELLEPVKRYLAEDRPFLGICLGLQLLFEESEEFGRHEGMGVLGGRVERIPERHAAEGLKIPHMGWNRVARKHESAIWEGVPDGGFFYFVHSYWVREATLADPGLALSETVYGEPFVSGVRRRNLYAFQFHPEKSQAAGLRLLENFAGIARRGGEG